ncbi:MAG: M20/M25/M40 family metallo-hydrolase [Candidatus Bathyarchaeia archaeon]
MAGPVSDWVKEHRSEAIQLLQEFIRVPSPSGHEKACGERVAEAMRVAGFDVSRVDALGDAMGVLKGSGGGRSLLMNGHIDHVPPGDMVDPYSARLMDGSAFGVEGEVVYGRSACDMKAAVAAMVMAGAYLRDTGTRLRGDYKVAAVAQEETGGAGTMSTIDRAQFLADVVLIGEATEMDLALGHRGSMKMSVVVRGRSCHASAPERGVNALYKASDLMTRIRGELIPRLPADPLFGKTSLAMTMIEVKPGAFNVVPEECRFYIDCRNVPGYPAEQLYHDLQAMIADQSVKDPDFKATVLPSPLINGQRGFTGFYTDPKDHPVVKEAETAIKAALGRAPRRKTWTFATDGRFYSWLGLPVIGFGPGDERFTHTAMDHIRVEDYLKTIEVYASVAMRICGVERAA